MRHKFKFSSVLQYQKLNSHCKGTCALKRRAAVIEFC